MSIFDFLKNLPLFVFILAFFVVFVIFLFGGFTLLRAGEDEEKIERGRRVLLNSLYSLFIILLIAFVFFSVSYLLQKGEVLQPPITSGDFPLSPDSNFPPAPQFVEIGKYYFVGPFLLKENDLIGGPVVYAVLCKNNEEYDIMYIDEVEKRAQLLKHSQYRCWLNNCNQKLKNLYLAVLWTPLDKYSSKQREEIQEELKSQISPPCPHTITRN